MSDDSVTSSKAQPFSALIAASSVIVALLYLAGFSYKWAYYYNFGVQHLIFGLSFQSIITASMEMIKLPKNLLITAMSLIATLLLVNFLISSIRKIGQSSRDTRVGRIAGYLARMLGFENQLVTDSIRAGAIFYVVYMLSSQMGYMQFRRHVVNSPENSLPVVTLIVRGEENQQMALACGTEWKTPPTLIGDAALVRNIEDYHRTCSFAGTVWRLLYRDDKSIYLFSSKPEQEGRPLTIVLPNTDKTILLMGELP
jgi:hypothetical protein